MKGKSPDPLQQSLLSSALRDILNPRHPLYQLTGKIPWKEIEEEFSVLYHHSGRPGIPIRLMVALLILKQLYNLSDETVVERWVENPYFQFFSGETVFRWDFPIHPTNLVYFRRRIGQEGVKKILQVSIALHGEKVRESEVLIDTTVQEKNITFPTDTKLYKRIIDQCVKIAGTESLTLRQSYRRSAKKLLMAQRWRNHPRNRKKATAAGRKLKTIAGRLIRELARKLPQGVKDKYEQSLELFARVIDQHKSDKNKIYSLHEPDVYCVSKGKEHKKYEFGAKAAIVVTKNSGIIVGALHIPGNKYDGHTLPEVLKQSTELVGQRPRVAICDRGFRGRAVVDGTTIMIPRRPGKAATAYEKTKARKRFRRRAGIEPIIGHLKSDYRLARNFLKGHFGDAINLMLAAAAFNFKKLMKQLQYFLSLLLELITTAFAGQNCLS